MLSIGASSQPRTPADATSNCRASRRSRNRISIIGERQMFAVQIARIVKRFTASPPSTGPDVQPGLGVDDELLGGRHAVGEQRRRRIGVALDHRQRDRTQLVVAGRGADRTHPRAVQGDVGAVGRQVVDRAVEVQQHEAARRTSERVHPGHGLLAAVAALLEVDGPTEQAGLVGDGAVVGVDADPADAGRDAQRLPGPRAHRRAELVGEGRQRRRAGAAARSGRAVPTTARSA